MTGSEAILHHRTIVPRAERRDTLLRQMMGRLKQTRAERVAATEEADPALPLAARAGNTALAA